VSRAAPAVRLGRVLNRLRLGDIGPPRLEKLAEDSRDLHLVALCLLNHAEVLVALDQPSDCPGHTR
jgi:hypothetical protein